MKRGGSLKRKKPKRLSRAEAHALYVKLRDEKYAEMHRQWAESAKRMENALWAVPERKPMRRSRLKPVGARSRRTAIELSGSREYALERAGGRCEWCLAKNGMPLDIHHIVPRQRGAGWDGLHRPRNLAAICRFPCHEKATLDPLSILDARGELGTRAALVWEQFQEWRSGKS